MLLIKTFETSQEISMLETHITAAQKALVEALKLFASATTPVAVRQLMSPAVHVLSLEEIKAL